ncbi:dienelactone hydrolase family protein [Mangrovivirga sp. M17]|uniref:Dienelactone hydrolase family protein n=1 Tax=Mangrovivirga halotolerans TaxID=2993936 RepID=A0ABT3RVQ1_9BACT|nr:dienelactone hydrolase family protein [Mangrovivirga halotolerans]MCX2745849.1 dienelactone hydrolase family protein [Mangrovivirga halotolerans]
MKFLVNFFFIILSASVFGQELKIDHFNFVTDSITYELKYAYNQPSQKNPPLLIYLHGVEGRGSDINRALSNSPFILGEKLKVQDKFLIITPQTYRPIDWNEGVVDALISQIIETKKFNNQKIFLTGISMGGNGVFKYITKYPNKVSAAAPIAGWGDPKQACKLKKLPIFAFHGELDHKEGRKTGSENMVNAIKACDGKAQVFLLKNTGHDAWTKTYSSEEFYSMLLNSDPTDTKFEEEIENEIDAKHSADDFLTYNKITDLHSHLNENSGLVTIQENEFWTVTDSGNPPYLYSFDTTGKIIDFYKITGASNNDWEELVFDGSHFFICDIGNNQNLRKNFQIYKISFPFDRNLSRLPSEIISFNLPDQNAYPPEKDDLNYDMEAVVSLRDSLYIFTKNRTNPYNGIVKFYSIPKTPGNHTAKFVGSFSVGEGRMLETFITGATYLKNSNILLLLSYANLYVISGWNGGPINENMLTKIPWKSFSQKEGITYLNDKVYFTDEKYKGLLGGTLNSLSLIDILKKSKKIIK